MGKKGRAQMMQIHDVEQGSPEWFAVRAGIPTASEFSVVMASGRGGGESKTRRTYMLKLAGERLTGVPTEPYSNPHLDRGHEMEPEVRDLYSFIQDEPIARVGFITNGPKGCSPDALVGERGMAEFKTALPHILLDRLLSDEFPPEHMAQCQGGLWVAEREWIDICVYWPGLPLFRKRMTRDEAYIRKLSAAVDKFNEELEQTVERIRAYGRKAAA
jgi:hypothetical protein